MPTIFISYRREDADDTAGRLHESLQRHFGDDNVFIDVDDIPVGADFVRAIETAVTRCDVLIVVIGPHWLSATDSYGRRLDQEGDFVRLELLTAVEHDVRIIPVVVRGATTPRADDLPEPLRWLGFRNAERVRHESWRSDVDRLCRAIDAVPTARLPAVPADALAAELAAPRLVAEPAAQVPDAVQPSRPRLWDWRTVRTPAGWSVAAIGVVAVGVALFMQAGRPDPGPPGTPATTAAPAAIATATPQPATPRPTDPPTVAPPATFPPASAPTEPPTATVTSPSTAPAPTVVPTVAPAVSMAPAVTGPQPRPTVAPVIVTSAPAPAGPAPTPPASVPDTAPTVPPTLPVPTPIVPIPTVVPSSTPTVALPTVTATPPEVACSSESRGRMLTGGGFEAVWNAQASVRRSIGCPSAREVGPGKSVIQYYRNGALLFWNLDSENTIYILIGDAAGAWQRYDAGTLDPRTVQYTCEPRGITPVRGFAKLLATEPALVERLGDGGCATTPEQGYLATREQFDQGIMLFLDIPLESGQRPFWVFSGSDRGAFTKYTR